MLINKKVCAYVRVSSKSKNQINSLNFQRDYWQKYLANKVESEFIGIFADEGISGKSLKNRDEFNKMINKARNKEIDIIYVKSISRFSRNILDLLQILDELRKINVAVIFQKENINSLDSKNIFTLNILSRIAEEELISISNNQKWAARKRFLKGSVELNGTILGYDLVKTPFGNKLVVNSYQAEIVKKIFDLYLEGLGKLKICQHLENCKYLTATGLNKWSASSIDKIIKNEKYVGNALLQKSYNENFCKIINDKENPVIPMVFVENNHEAIIDKDIFEKVQNEIKKRENNKLKHSKKIKSLFCGKLICGKCGSKYLHKLYYYKRKAIYGYYTCSTYQTHGIAICNNKNIKEIELIQLFSSCLIENNKLIKSNELIKEKKSQLNSLLIKERNLYKLDISGNITKKLFEEELSNILIKIKNLENEINHYFINNSFIEINNKNNISNNINKYLDKVAICDNIATFIFYNGNKLRRTFSNGKSGNANIESCKENYSNTCNKKE